MAKPFVWSRLPWIAMVRKRCEFMCPLNRVFGLFGLCHFFLEVAVQHKGGNTTKNANAPQIWLIGLHFGYTTISHTCYTFPTQHW